MSKENKLIQIKLIVNLSAGKISESAENLQLVKGYFEKSGFKVDVSITKQKEAATSLARQAVKEGYKVVIAMGGDGTVKAVMHGLIGKKVRLGIVPTGIENNIALSLGIPNDLLEACALIASDNTLKLDMGQVNCKKGKKSSFFEMATLGLSAAIHPDKNRAATRKLSSVKAAARILIHDETRPKVFLTLDNASKIEVETMLVMVSNAPVTGKSFMAAPDASPRDGRLDVSVYPDFGKSELLGYYADLMDGGYSGEGKVQHYQAGKIKIKTSPRMDVMADGVPLGKGTVKIKVRPGALRVISTGKAADIEKQPKDNINKLPVQRKHKPAHAGLKDVEMGSLVPVGLIVDPDHHKESKISLE